MQKLLFLLFVLIGCSSDPSAKNTVGDASFKEEKNKASQKTLNTGPHISYKNSYKLVSSDLIYQALAKKSGNFVFSPFGVYSSLTLLHEGSSGDTRTQIEEILGFSPHDAKRRKELQELFLQYSNTESVHLANSFWLNKNHKINIKKEFRAVLERYYEAKITTTSFGDVGAQKISSWVRIKTKDKVNDLVTYLPEEQGIVLVNGLYFDDIWEEGFDPNLTRQGEFNHNPPYWLYQDFMHNPTMNKTQYAENAEWKVASIAYQSGQFEFIVFLPNNANYRNLDFSYEFFDSWVKKLQPQPLNVSLPRFNVAWKIQGLDQSLIELGLVNIFDAHLADINHLTESDVFVDQIAHKSALSIDEGSGKIESEPAEETEYKRFNVNHPFWFVVYDSQNDLIISLGQYVGPQG